jgi:hypothetical protein
MDNDGFDLYLSDDIDLLISRHIADCLKTRRLQNATGCFEGQNPFDDLSRQLELIQTRVLPQAIDRIKFLDKHKHQYDESNFCIHCGEDGLA